MHVEDGKLTKVEGDPEGPLNHGYLCPIGAATTQLVYHPDRLKYPQRRIGPHGSGKWERISWDEALDEISEKVLKIRAESGPESIAMGTGTGRHHIRWVSRFGNALGTPNWCEPGFAQCFHPRVNTCIQTMGDLPVCDFTGGTPPALTMYWGHNPPHSGPDGETRFNVREALLTKPRLITIDPRETVLAKKSEVWLQLRPGTDDALGLAFLNVIIEEDLYDHDFCEKYTHGFKELAEHVHKFTPEWAEPITWVPADKIRAAARLFATVKPAMLEWGCAIEHTPNTIQTIRALSMIPAITGNIDVPGGWIFGMHGAGRFPSLIENLDPEVEKKRLGYEKYKMLCGEGADLPACHIPTLIDAMLYGEPYRVRAFLVFGNNTLTTYANTNMVYKALMKLDFMVCADLFMTPTAELADIVLPAASWPELNQICALPTIAGNVVMSNQQVVRMGECKSDEEIFVELARRMNLPVCTRAGRGSARQDAEERRAEGRLQGSDRTRLDPHEAGIPEVREKRIQDADRQARALLDAARGDGLRAAAVLRGTAGEPALHARGSRGLSARADDRRTDPDLLQLGAPAAAAVPQGPPRSALRHPPGHGCRARDRGRRMDVHRDAPRPNQTDRERDDQDRCARDPLRARLVVPGEGRPRLRNLGVERQPPDRQSAGRSIRRWAPISCAGFCAASGRSRRRTTCSGLRSWKRRPPKSRTPRPA